MKAVLFLLKSSWRQVIIGSICSAIAASFYIWALKLLNQVILSDTSVDIFTFLSMSGLVIASAILAIYTGHYITHYYEFKVSELREKFSEKILQANFEKIEKNAGVIIPVLQNDINTIGFFAKVLPELIVAIFKIIAICIYMLLISWQLTLSIFSTFAIILSLIVIILPRFHREEKAIVKNRNLLYTQLEGLVKGIKELSLNIDHKKNYARANIGPISHTHAKHVSNLNVLNVFVGKVAESLVLVSLGLIILLMKYYANYTNELFFQFLTLVLFILPSLIQVIAFFRNVKKAEIALDQIESLDIVFAEKASDEMVEQALLFEKGSGKDIITVEAAEYVYKHGVDDDISMGPFDFSVRENEVLLINGGNGSGKTTLSKILTGLYLPHKGNLKFQDQVITEKNIHSYRNLYSAVFADSYVFQDLGYIHHDRVAELGQKYLNELGLADKVSLENGIKISNTNLSFGQMSRLNLLRALLENKMIYLFDEWAANQDPHFKAKFYLEIIPDLKKAGKTVILISHDDKYFDTADRLLTLSNGSVEKITENIAVE